MNAVPTQRAQAPVRLSAPARAACLAMVAAAIALRFPMLVSHPRMWAEEGRDFFARARTLPLLDVLTAPHIGYFSLFTNLAGLLAAWAPLEQAAAVMTALAFAVQLLPFAVVLAGKSSLWRDPLRQFLATLVLLFVLPNRETFLTTTNSQFVLSLAVLLVALEDEEPSRAGLAFRGALVVLAGLTGPPTCLLAPALAWRAFRLRTRAAVLLFALLSACCLVQAGYLFHDALASHQLLGQRRSPIPPVLLGEIVLVKSLAIPTVGGYATKMLHDWMAGLQSGHALLAIAAVALWAGVLALAASGISPATRVTFLLGVITLTLVSSALSLGTKEDLLVPMLGERYYQAPNSVLFIALAAGAGWRTWTSLLRSAPLALSLTVGLATYQQPFGWTEGPDWKAEVALWRSDPTHMVRIWPEGWAMPLDPRAAR